MERLIRTRKEWPAIGWGQWQVLGTRNPAVLAVVCHWDGSSVLAVHNFSDVPAKMSVALPKEDARGRWEHIFGPGDAEAPDLASGRLTCEIAPYGYHWYGAREGV